MSEETTRARIESATITFSPQEVDCILRALAAASDEDRREINAEVLSPFGEKMKTLEINTRTWIAERLTGEANRRG